MTAVRAAAVLLVATVGLGGCSGTTSDDELLVAAAASLTDAFTAIEDAYEDANPGTDVVLNLAGSATLREQVLGGAPVDVLALASEDVMTDVVEAGRAAGEPTTIARNRLAIAVPAGNPAGVTGAADLADDELLLGLCSAQVPCGAYARQALARLGVDASPDTNEPDVRALLTKLAVGELDAGITYVTDVVASDGEVEAVDLGVDLAATYPMVVLADSPRPDRAADFAAFVTGPEGQQLLAAAGFDAAPGPGTP